MSAKPTFITIPEGKIIASVDLDSDTFQPHTGVQTSILILQKKTDAEKLADLKGGLQPYNIFMAKVDKVGKPELDKVPDDQTLDIPAMFEAWKREEGLGW